MFFSSCSSSFGLLFLLFLLSSVSGIFSLPSSFCLGSFCHLCWLGSFPSSFLCFPYRSAFLSCLGLFAPAVLCHSSLFLHEVLLCFLPCFRISPFRLCLLQSVVSFHLVPSGFVLPLLFPALSVGLFFGSLVCPLIWLVLPLGFSFPCSFLAPRSSSRFLSAWCYWCLRIRP